jgi:hypothetical protein
MDRTPVTFPVMTSRRRARLAVPVLVACASALTACAESPDARPAPAPIVPSTPDPSSADVRDEDGWVWESYRDVEVAVPPGWAHGTGDVAAAQWCISDTTYATPFVVRPGIAAEYTCPGPTPGAADPATLISKGGTFVSFARAAAFPNVRQGSEGDRVTTVVGSVLLRVQAEPEIRDKILASARTITADAIGCPVTDPISLDPYRRPQPARKLSELRGVTKILACRYVLTGPPTSTDAAPTEAPTETDGETSSQTSAETPTTEPAPSGTPTASQTPVPPGTSGPGPTLYSSLEVTGETAARAVQAMADARSGGGPNDIGGCPSPDGIGTEAIVLRILSTSGISQVYLRYGGCNGFDDGIEYRALTREAVGPFVSGPNAIADIGEALAGILDDPDAPATSGDPL